MGTHRLTALGAGFALSIACAAPRPATRDESRAIGGQLISTSEGQVRVQLGDEAVLPLVVNRSTAVLLDGEAVPASRLTAGEDVRASYQMVGGKATALRIEARSRDAEPRQDPGMMQGAPGDQSAPDDKIPPEPPSEIGPTKDGQPEPQLQSPNQAP